MDQSPRTDGSLRALVSEAMARDVRNLEVFRESDRLLFEVVALVATVSRPGRFTFCDQLTRAALSVPLNLVEGSQRSTTREYARFVEIAAGSAAALGAVGSFQQGFANLRASANPAEESLDEIRQRTMELSEELGARPSGIQDVITELLKAGAPLASVLEEDAKATAEFAKVGQLAADQAATVMADAMNVFGESSQTTISGAGAAFATEEDIEALPRIFRAEAGCSWCGGLGVGVRHGMGLGGVGSDTSPFPPSADGRSRAPRWPAVT